MAFFSASVSPTLVIPNNSDKYNISNFFLIFRIENEGSAVKEGEEVTLVGFRGVPLEPVCPEDRKIKTVTAFIYGPKLTNKGFVESFYGEAKDKCDGNESCSLEFEDTGRFLRYRLYTYRCVE